MKKIIKGKLYDTNTAELVATDNYSNPDDYHYWWESLYKKITGEFFLYGEGGPLSQYRRQYGMNEWGGSTVIIPMSEEEARSWLEEHADADTYIKLFGMPEE